MSLYDVPRQLPYYVVAEIQARIDYAALPWRERLTTMPPEGWPVTAAHVGAWCAARIRRKREGQP